MRTQPERTGGCRALALALVTVLAAVAHAEAQTAASFDELPLVLRPGDLVTVTDDRGRDLGGRIIELSPSTLSLEYTGARLDLRADQVSTIRHRRFDSLQNGMMIGLGVAAIPVFLLGMAVAAEGPVEGYEPFALLMLGVGGGIGAGVDALIRESRVIYGRPGAARKRLTIVSRVMHRVTVTVSKSLTRDSWRCTSGGTPATSQRRWSHGFAASCLTLTPLYSLGT